jgi:glycosyltransferase involved in cell wall biosynthesis
MIEVTVLVPCYNQGKYLQDCLRSVKDQTYSNWQCIIINDGSPDDTEVIVKEWEKKDSRFVYIYKDNGGLSSARNAGIHAAEGNYILPLDADDKISANYLEECVKAFGTNQRLALVYGSAELFGTESGIWDLPSYSYKRLLTENMIHCSAMYKKQAVLEAGLYDENLNKGSEDWELWIRLLDEQSEVLRLNNICFYYRVKEDSMIKQMSGDTHYKHWSRNHIFNKNIAKYKLYDAIDLVNQIHALEAKNAHLEEKLCNPHIYFGIRNLFSSLMKALSTKLGFRKNIK